MDLHPKIVLHTVIGQDVTIDPWSTSNDLGPLSSVVTGYDVVWGPLTQSGATLGSSALLALGLIGFALWFRGRKGSR